MAMNSKNTRATEATTFEAVPVAPYEAGKANKYETVNKDNGQVEVLVLTDLVVNSTEKRYVVDESFIKYSLGPTDRELFADFKVRLKEQIEYARNEEELIKGMECTLYYKKFAINHADIVNGLLK
jgi:hypothetical protein